MKYSNLGFIKISILILIILVGFGIAYFFVFKNNSNIKEHPNAVVFVDNNKLYRFDFDEMKKEPFEESGDISLRSKFFFNKNRNVFALVNLPENFDYEKNPIIKVKAFFYNRDTLKKISEMEVSIIYGAAPDIKISPDGQKFTLIEAIYYKENLGKNLKIFDINGKQLDEVKNDATREYKLLSWSPSNDKILFISNTVLEVEPADKLEKLDSKLKIYDLNSKTLPEIKPQDSISKEYFRDWPGKHIKVEWYEEDKFSFMVPDIPNANNEKYIYSLTSNNATKDSNYITMKLPKFQHPNAVVNEENLFWLNDNKSVVVGVEIACGLVECEKGAESIVGVYKVNVDGTNWQKIEEIPNLKIFEK